MSWTPIATQGQTEDEVRAALHEQAALLLDEWCRAQRAEGAPLDEIRAVAVFAKRRQAEQIEHELPMVMRDLSVSARLAAVH